MLLRFIYSLQRHVLSIRQITNCIIDSNKNIANIAPIPTTIARAIPVRVNAIPANTAISVPIIPASKHLP